MLSAWHPVNHGYLTVTCFKACLLIYHLPWVPFHRDYYKRIIILGKASHSSVGLVGETDAAQIFSSPPALQPDKKGASNTWMNQKVNWVCISWFQGWILPWCFEYWSSVNERRISALTNHVSASSAPCVMWCEWWAHVWPCGTGLCPQHWGEGWQLLRHWCCDKLKACYQPAKKYSNPTA